MLLNLLFLSSLALAGPHLTGDAALHYTPVENPYVNWTVVDTMNWPGPRTDANSPLIWIDETLTLFFNNWHIKDERAYSRIATGPNLLNLTTQGFITIGDDPRLTHRWFESVLRMDNGDLYAFFHSEEGVPCSFYIKSPQIGVALSQDNGYTWQNLGFILESPMSENNCDARNGFFSNGVGDFSVLLDKAKKYVYIYFANYPMNDQVKDQGISAARIRLEDLSSPAGKAWRWFNGAYSEPGMGGRSSALFKTEKDFNHPDPDSFWGPAIHYNTFLNKYVMVMPRTQGGNPPVHIWPTEGIYVTMTDDLSLPQSWTEPVKIAQGGHWYPQFVGIDHNQQETDSKIGQWARFFLEGESKYLVQFKNQ